MILDYMYRLYQLYAPCPRQKDMAFKRSAVRFRLSPPRPTKRLVFFSRRERRPRRSAVRTKTTTDPGETARSPHLSFREAKPCTPGWPLLALRANSPSGNLLEHCTNTHGVAGDCTTGIPFGHHVGLWPSRNDMENRTWSFF